MPAEHSKSQLHLDTLNRALNSGTYNHVRQLLNDMPPAEAAHLLTSSPPRERKILWRLVDRNNEGEVLQHLNDEVRSQFMSKMNTEELVHIVEDLETDDLADLLQDLPDAVTRQVLQMLDEQNRQRIEEVLVYPEDTAGGLMNTDDVSIRPNISLEVVLRYLRRHKDIPEMTDTLIVVNRKNQFVGTLPLTKLLTSDPTDTVREAMSTEVAPIQANTPARDVATLFERLDLISAPVIDDKNILIGRITIDDVVDVIRDEADHSLLSMAGLDEDEDTFAPVLQSSKRRAVWLGINLVTALIASSVIGIFSETIEKVVALAVLMPIVASMGGIAGSQTLTLVIRGMALGQISKNNSRYLLMRELAVSILNGIVWSVVLGGIASWWFSDPTLGYIIAAAMLINIIVAGVAGSSLPLILRFLGIDPALAGTVLLTTITDVIGFLSFLSLATYFYL